MLPRVRRRARTTSFMSNWASVPPKEKLALYESRKGGIIRMNQDGTEREVYATGEGDLRGTRNSDAGFFGHMLWSSTILIPIFLIMTFVFFG